jgi:hypothetical protein
MFLNYIKEISLKRILKKSLNNVKSNTNLSAIKTVGLILDESYFYKKNELIDALVANGVRKDRINVVVFKDKINSNEVFSFPTFNNKHISLNGKFTEKVVSNFINEKFDLLISYYDVNKASLMLITNNSKANFKVGFANIDKRINNLTISTSCENYHVFVFELFKYLKILKKI